MTACTGFSLKRGTAAVRHVTWKISVYMFNGAPCLHYKYHSIIIPAW